MKSFDVHIEWIVLIANFLLHQNHSLLSPFVRPEILKCFSILNTSCSTRAGYVTSAKYSRSRAYPYLFEYVLNLFLIDKVV